jgi:hypothetical protein
VRMAGRSFRACSLVGLSFRWFVVGFFVCSFVMSVAGVRGI